MSSITRIALKSINIYSEGFLNFVYAEFAIVLYEGVLDRASKVKIVPQTAF